MASNPTNKPLPNDGKFKFLDQQFTIAELRDMGIDDDKAIELRKKILENNEKSKKKMGRVLPIVLVPHHQIRIWRVDRLRDPSTGRFLRPDLFRVEPNNGSKDIVGISFSYSYESASTDFTITFNNARGKNKTRFASGDLVEFYFQLVDDKTLQDLSSGNSLFVQNKETTDGMPLCFTGVLDKWTAKHSTDGMTIEWSGRSGGYILAERFITQTFPIDANLFAKGLAQSSVMSYEEIIWRIITETTGMVMGEIDLGITKTTNFDGTEGEGLEDISTDLMGQVDKTLFLGKTGDMTSKRRAQFDTDFLPGLESILKQYEYCCFEENVTSGDFEKMGGGAEKTQEKKKRVRWSCLLEYDLLRPRIFGVAEAKDPKVFGDYKFPLVASEDSPNSEEAISRWDSALASETKGESSAPVTEGVVETIRFKTVWAMRIYAYQWKRVQTNGKILQRLNPIRTQVGLEERKPRLFQITSEMAKYGSPQDCWKGWIELYKIVNGGEPSETELADFVKGINELQAQEVSWTDWFSGWFATGKKEGEEMKLDPDASKMPRYERWEPNTPFDATKYMLIPPAVEQESESTPSKWTIPKEADAKAVGGVVSEKDDTKVLIQVFSTYAYAKDDNPDLKFQISQSMSENPDFVMINFGSNGKISMPTYVDNIPNRIDAIAQVLENTGLFDAIITKEGVGDLKQRVKVNKFYSLKLKAQSSSWGKSLLTNVEFPADGKVLDKIEDILGKFFACVLIVDEYGIGHVRPRYKNLQTAANKKAVPIWGLYAGQPIYPRIFDVEMSEEMKGVVSSVIVHGQNNAGDQIFAKVDHVLLQHLFGEIQRVEDENRVVNTKYEAHVVARNKLLDYARKAMSVACKCDLIPELRPGHRVDLFAPSIGAAGQFVVETIGWTYSKDEGVFMNLGLSFAELASEDAFTSAAIVLESQIDADYDKQMSQSIQERRGLFGFPLMRASELQTGRDEDSLKRISKEYADKVLPEFSLGKDGGVIRFIPREGFERKPAADDGSGNGTGGSGK